MEIYTNTVATDFFFLFLLSATVVNCLKRYWIYVASGVPNNSTSVFRSFDGLSENPITNISHPTFNSFINSLVHTLQTFTFDSYDIPTTGPKLKWLRPAGQL